MIKDHCQLDGNQKNTNYDPVQILYLVQGIKMQFGWICTPQAVSRLHSRLLQKNNINEKETLHTKLINLVFEPFILQGCYAVQVCTCLLSFWNHGSSMNSRMEFFMSYHSIFPKGERCQYLDFEIRRGQANLEMCARKFM